MSQNYLSAGAIVQLVSVTSVWLVPARYSKGPLFRKSIVQIRATVLAFELRLGLGLGLRLGSALGLGFR